MWGSYFILQGDGVQKSALKMLVKNVSKFSYDSGRRMTQPEEICARVVGFVRDQQTTKFLLITNISNYISFPPQIAYKLIEAG